MFPEDRAPWWLIAVRLAVYLTSAAIVVVGVVLAARAYF